MKLSYPKIDADKRKEVDAAKKQLLKE